eukprot:maker-scaffold4471_size5885-snap-gene-0.3 protein:Tk00184 transcript:maker-scaffold4471_size5885-snap-gene-0.3-mRNA-1 annotation:"beta cyclase"
MKRNIPGHGDIARPDADGRIELHPHEDVPHPSGGRADVFGDDVLELLQDLLPRILLQHTDGIARPVVDVYRPLLELWVALQPRYDFRSPHLSRRNNGWDAVTSMRSASSFTMMSAPDPVSANAIAENLCPWPDFCTRIGLPPWLTRPTWTSLSWSSSAMTVLTTLDASPSSWTTLVMMALTDLQT